MEDLCTVAHRPFNGLQPQEPPGLLAMVYLTLTPCARYEGRQVPQWLSRKGYYCLSGLVITWQQRLPSPTLPP